MNQALLYDSLTLDILYASDLNNYNWPNYRYAPDTVTDVSASSGISSP